MDTRRTDFIRRAVASGEHRNALRLWDDYAAGIRQEILHGTCTAARMAEAREFLEWARRAVLCSRAQDQNRLNAIHVAKQYGPAQPHPVSFLRTSL
jgi:hypothetical protein